MPKGKVGHKFVVAVVILFRCVCLRKHNSEMVIIFMACILQLAHGVRASKDNRELMECRMDLWIEGRSIDLVKDIKE